MSERECKFLTTEDIKPGEILLRLEAQFGETCLKKTQVYHWHKKFLEGRVNVEKKPHDHRPQTSLTVLLVDFLHERRTVNAAYYCKLLQETKLAYRRKRRQFPIREVILLHDNARPHTANLTREKVEDMHWTTLDTLPTVQIYPLVIITCSGL